MASLWSPMQLNGHTIPNRVVMAPTVKFCLHDGSGYVPAELVEHYRLRARSGTGLIIVEATAPTPGGKVHDKALGIWDDSTIDGLAQIADAIHQEGSKAILQLCYTGVSSKDPKSDRTSASPEYAQHGSGMCLSHAMTVEEIQALELAHQAAALRAYKAGYDGVEIHCTHGKLYGRFFDGVTNVRTDQYGGSFENRARIFTETLARIRQVVPADFIVGLRMGVNLPDFDQARGIVTAIDAAHPDYFHFSKHIIPAPPRPDIPGDFPCAPTVWDGTRLRRHVSVPVMVSFQIATPEQAEYLLEQDLTDFVTIGRGMLADYDWARKAKAHLPVDVCRHCPSCQWRMDAQLCPAVRLRGQSGTP